MSEIDISSVISKMRVLTAQAQGQEINPAQEAGASDKSFSNLMVDALNQVNDVQRSAGQLAQAFEQGDKNVDIAEVMIALQKADVSFQAINQVRNRLVTAYQDIMNMPI